MPGILRARFVLILIAAAIASACSTAEPMKALAQPSTVLVTDQNGNAILQISDAARLQQLTAFMNQQRTHKQWRVHDPAPVSDVVLHLCRGSQLEAVFGTQTRLFSSDGHDAPAQAEEVDELLRLLGQDRSLFARLPLKQGHTDVSCH